MEKTEKTETGERTMSLMTPAGSGGLPRLGCETRGHMTVLQISVEPCNLSRQFPQVQMTVPNRPRVESDVFPQSSSALEPSGGSAVSHLTVYAE